MIGFLKDKSNKAYGVGRLESLENHLEDSYKGQPILIKEKILDLPQFTMNDLDDNKKHCSLTAITRIMNYYALRGYDDIPSEEKEIYATVKKKGLRLGYLPIIGTFPFRVSSISRASFREYNYSIRARGIYFWNFYSDILAEIDEARPLILNIMRGYYRKHTITVVGYRIYSVNGDIKHILVIQDGWDINLRFLDFNRFTNNILFAGIASFNKIRIKHNN